MMKANLEVAAEGTLEDLLGVKIYRRKDGIIHITQPHLMEKIVKDLVQDNPKIPSKSTPAQLSKLLHSHNQPEDLDKHSHYRSLVQNFNYLEKCCRPYIAYATHQCDHLSVNPKNKLAKSLLHLGNYLRGTIYKGTIYLPNMDKDFEAPVDADFAGNWDKEDS